MISEQACKNYADLCKRRAASPNATNLDAVVWLALSEVCEQAAEAAFEYDVKCVKCGKLVRVRDASVQEGNEWTCRFCG